MPQRTPAAPEPSRTERPLTAQRLAEFLAGTGDAHTPARELVRAAEQSAEMVTLGVVAPKKKKKPAEDA